MTRLDLSGMSFTEKLGNLFFEWKKEGRPLRADARECGKAAIEKAAGKK